MFMNVSGDPNQTDAASGDKDRRVNAHLRVVFESACRITAPFFDRENSWGGSSLTMYARQTLREAYPDLTQQDLAILLSAVLRFHRNNVNQ